MKTLENSFRGGWVGVVCDVHPPRPPLPQISLCPPILTYFHHLTKSIDAIVAERSLSLSLALPLPLCECLSLTLTLSPQANNASSVARRFNSPYQYR